MPPCPICEEATYAEVSEHYSGYKATLTLVAFHVEWERFCNCIWTPEQEIDMETLAVMQHVETGEV